MEKKIIYHGSNVEVSHPRILQNGFYKDFGYGFYCTVYEQQAKRWAITRHGNSVVNTYEYEPNDKLKVLRLQDLTEDWLAFVVDCRRGIEHAYDVVEGPMADDRIWNFVEAYVAGNISKSAFWELTKFDYPTHQIVFCTEDALKALQFVESEKL